MKILLIGNGFDIEHGLPTKYAQFLDFVKEFQTTFIGLKDHTLKPEDIQNDYFKSLFSDNESIIVDALLSFTFGNSWIDYFQKTLNSHMENKENWIDFEREISDIIKTLDCAIKFYEENNKEASNNITLPPHLKHKLLEIIGDEYMLDSYNIKNCINTLLNDLNKLICALEIYIWDYIDFTGHTGNNIEYYNPDIDEIHPDAVLSFNYSDTYRRLYTYNQKDIKYDFIHGKAKNNLLDPFKKEDCIEKCNLVLGIDEYLPDDRKNREIDFIAFKKYYQRIYKQTGCQYKTWLEQIDRNIKEEKSEENFLYIFGHSLDETDGDILRDLINHTSIQTIIYYKSKKILGQQIANLVKVLGADKVIEKVYGNRPSIKFVQQKERIRIENSPFSFKTDLSKLEQIYNLNLIDALRMLFILEEKIQNQSLEYFYSQENVISLYDILQRMGLSKKYKHRLLAIAYKLMDTTSLKKVKQHSPSNWNHLNFDNTLTCDSDLIDFIDLINIHNRNCFEDEDNFEPSHNAFFEIKELLFKREKINKKKYEEILKNISRIFSESSIDREELWNVLIRISVGPAKDIAKETLENLIEDEPPELYIVLYTHLLYKIQEYNYFH